MGIDYLKQHQEVRASDLKHAFMDDSSAGIICAIGEDDTYRLLPYLLEDKEFVDAVEENPKLFTGFSDTTINHLMFYKLGLTTYYGPTFICDLGEIANEMLPYTEEAFRGYLKGNECKEIVSSPLWYEERKDFSINAMGTERFAHKEERGLFDVINGILVGKPQDEMYYEDYKNIYVEVIDNKELSILYNVNFGHSTPRCVIPYGINVEVDAEKKKIVFLESMFR